MATIIKGDELMLFKNDQSLAFATAHTLTISGSTIDISSKDHGYWGASEIGNITWEITSENLYTDADYDALFNAMINKEKVIYASGSIIEEAEDKEVEKYYDSVYGEIKEDDESVDNTNINDLI